jgi:predicted nucleic acid-binding protein
MTTDRFFFDTNILVYAYDSSEPCKQDTAQKLLEEGIREETGTVSVQVLGEFFNVVTRRIKNLMSPAEAQKLIKLFGLMNVAQIDLAKVHLAIEIHERYQITYWDSLIVAAASQLGCKTIVSEDLNPGQQYNGVLVVNPFTK